jgi:hypothetical protein
MAISWITPKEDWIAGDGFGFADTNRIEGNIDYIRNQDATFFGIKKFDNIVRVDTTEARQLQFLDSDTFDRAFISFENNVFFGQVGTSFSVRLGTDASSGEFLNIADNGQAKLTSEEITPLVFTNTNADTRSFIGNLTSLVYFGSASGSFTVRVGSEGVDDEAFRVVPTKNTLFGGTTEDGTNSKVQVFGNSTVNGISKISTTDITQLQFLDSDTFNRSLIGFLDDIYIGKAGTSFSIRIGSEASADESFNMSPTGLLSLTSTEITPLLFTTLSGDNRSFIGNSSSLVYFGSVIDTFTVRVGSEGLNDEALRCSPDLSTSFAGAIEPTSTPVNATWTTSQPIARGVYNYVLSSNAGGGIVIKQGATTFITESTVGQGGSFYSDGATVTITVPAGSVVTHWKY